MRHRFFGYFLVGTSLTFRNGFFGVLLLFVLLVSCLLCFLLLEHGSDLILCQISEASQEIIDCFYVFFLLLLDLFLHLVHFVSLLFEALLILDVGLRFLNAPPVLESDILQHLVDARLHLVELLFFALAEQFVQTVVLFLQ